MPPPRSSPRSLAGHPLVCFRPLPSPLAFLQRLLRPAACLCRPVRNAHRLCQHDRINSEPALSSRPRLPSRRGRLCSARTVPLRCRRSQSAGVRCSLAPYGETRPPRPHRLGVRRGRTVRVLLRVGWRTVSMLFFSHDSSTRTAMGRLGGRLSSSPCGVLELSAPVAWLTTFFLLTGAPPTCNATSGIAAAQTTSLDSACAS